jgi:signal peptidase
MHRPTPLTLARWILDGTLIVLVGVVFVGLLVARVMPALGHEAVTITGRSMEPTIPIASAIVLERIAPEAISVGDIVTVKIPDAHVTYTHRVVEIVDRENGRWLRTKGDHNAVADPALVRVEWVVGRHFATFPGFGLLLELLSMVPGMLAVLGLSLTLYLSARLIEDLEWEIEDERRRPTRPAFPGRLPVDSARRP